MERNNPHFGNWHFCAGCPFSLSLHEGCVVESNVKIIKISQPEVSFQTEPKEDVILPPET